MCRIEAFVALGAQITSIFTCPRGAWGRKCVRGVPNRRLRGHGGADHAYFYVSQENRRAGQEMRDGYAESAFSWPWGRRSLVFLRAPGAITRGSLALGAHFTRIFTCPRRIKGNRPLRNIIETSWAGGMGEGPLSMPYACLSSSSIHSPFLHLLSNVKHGVGPQGARRIQSLRSFRRPIL